MVDSDAVEPGANARFTSELPQVVERFDEDIVRCILGLRWIAKHPEREIVNRLGMLAVDGTEFR